MSKIEIRNLSFEYEAGGFKALDCVDLSVEEGEFVCIVGHSGCGKSTLLSLVDGLILPTQGEIRIDGMPVTGPGTDRSMVFQHYSLFPWLTAKKNVTFGIRQANPEISKREADALAMLALEKVELALDCNKYPFQLSGGMRQRVAIARAFAMNSDIMLLDEPFGALDPRIRYSLQAVLEELWNGEAKKKTVLFVTHDIEEAIVLADRIVFMEPGRIAKELPVDFPRPRNRRQIMQTAECCSMRKSLIELFYMSQEKGEDGW